MALALYTEDDLITDRAVTGQMRWPYFVFLPEVVTLPWDWLVADAGSIPRRLIAQIEEHGYDQVPISCPDDPIGYHLLSSSLLKLLASDGGALSHGTGYLPNDTRRVRGVFIRGDEVFECLHSSRAVLVYSLYDAQDPAVAVDQIVGLLSITDLEKPPIRMALFGLILDLETRLARLVDQVFAGSDSWITHLSVKAQSRILGNVEYARRSGVAIRPMEELYLAELLTIAAKGEGLRELLGFKSRASVAKSVNRIAHLRNVVTHPGRVMASGIEGVQRVSRALSAAIDMLERAQRALGETGPTSEEE